MPPPIDFYAAMVMTLPGLVCQDSIRQGAECMEDSNSSRWGISVWRPAPLLGTDLLPLN